MNKTLVVLLHLFVLLGSCRKEADVSFREGRFYIEIDDAGVTDVDAIPWSVGPLRRQKVAKGFRLKIDFPLIDHSVLEDINKKFEADSWIIKLVRDVRGKTEVVGRSYLPFVVYQKDGSFKVKQVREGYLSVYYSAASISSRLEKLSCPAFKHRLKISKYNLGDESAKGKILASYAYEKRVGGTSSKLGYGKTIYNGGHSLIGKYGIEVALFNSIKKNIKSSFSRVGRDVNIQSEVLSSIKGCENSTIPDIRLDNRNIIDAFKFGQ